jgi:hypothetical protein
VYLPHDLLVDRLRGVDVNLDVHLSYNHIGQMRNQL